MAVDMPATGALNRVLIISWQYRKLTPKNAIGRKKTKTKAKTMPAYDADLLLSLT
jgi:hypothetical protein